MKDYYLNIINIRNMHVSQKSQTWVNMAEAPRQSFEKYLISGMIQKYTLALSPVVENNVLNLII